MTVQVDVHKLPVMLTALRLPSFQGHWQELAERADSEGWQAARFLAALAELELAQRDTRWMGGYMDAVASLLRCVGR
ncbi:hypothetical protein GCM10010869_62440 [Mesorhizobium tianshanense]|uniref:Uncharacterized protein n=1 Tax=Mesorhizobium tianshanense TaxID=39844 RepID=A0A562MKD2_9HYPH|nr:hypothetical protein [Mesorhizobium tianshanense]TWI20379.1 hypothetical protein IQ26_06986 [Mesorhizobium tianshanense]GLS40647.1 hypothetical protein GCM10010869_62440 [Mesorhizobium tianshanense]